MIKIEVVCPKCKNVFNGLKHECSDQSSICRCPECKAKILINGGQGKYE